MVTLRTIRKFYDTTIRDSRLPGDEFEATVERAAQIIAALPGYAEVVEPAHEDLSGKTVAQLRAICAERGIKVPKGAKKEDIVRLLEV